MKNDSSLNCSKASVGEYYSEVTVVSFLEEKLQPV